MQPTLGQTKALDALCDAVLMPGDIEAVTPGEGMPCTACILRFAALTARILAVSRRILDVDDLWQLVAEISTAPS